MDKYKKAILIFFLKMFGFIGFFILGCILDAQGFDDYHNYSFFLGTLFGFSLFFDDVK